MARQDNMLSRLRDYYTLTKPEVNLLILMTTSAGYYLASRGPFEASGLVNTLIGTLLVASGTATVNQWMERFERGGNSLVVSGGASGENQLESDGQPGAPRLCDLLADSSCRCGRVKTAICLILAVNEPGRRGQHLVQA